MKSLLNSLIETVKEAGAIIKDAHRLNTSDVTEKEGTANFVTVYDVKVQDFLIDRISGVVPDAYFFSEEKENDPAVFQKDFCFVIDPIDGTTNFIRDLQLSCISVAMFSKGEVVIGIIYDPYRDETFYALKDGGAFLNGAPISVSDTPFDSSIVAFGTTPYTKQDNGRITAKLMYELLMNCADVRRLGSAALDLAYVAVGRFDLFFEALLFPWDFAAGQLLIKEAGGIITDMQGNELLSDKRISVIAGNKNAYPLLLEKARKYV